MPITLGKVFLSSGMGFYKERVSDWAFVELDHDTLLSRKTMPNYSALQKREFRLRELAFAPEAPANDYGEIQEDGIYLKTGRTEDTTIGTCNGVKLVSSICIRYDKGTPVLNFRANEYVIFSNTTDCFCKPGDSGSLVYDIYGNICGLLWGELVDETSKPLGIVTTFPDGCEAIKEKGGILFDPHIITEDNH
jgi:hypothetical protein